MLPRGDFWHPKFNHKGTKMKLKKILLPLLSILIGLLFTLILLELIFRVLPTRESLKVLPVNHDNPVIRFAPNRDVIWSSGAGFSIITKKHVNNYGFLNDQNYSKEETSPLLAIIGDSYVAAKQVENNESMHGILSRITEGKGRVYSFGSSGSPLSTYLAYAEYAKQFNPKGLAFIIIGNDFDESLLKYKKDPAFHYFQQKEDRLVLTRVDYHSSFIKDIARKSALIRYLTYNAPIKALLGATKNSHMDKKIKYVGNTQAGFTPERLQDSQNAVNRFFELLPSKTAVPKEKILFVMDGIRPNLYDAKSLQESSGSYYDIMRQYFIKIATIKGYEVLDMQPLFIKAHQENNTTFEFPTDAHWNRDGHKLVAEKMANSKVYKELFKP
jgi:hypothetical protein